MVSKDFKMKFEFFLKALKQAAKAYDLDKLKHSKFDNYFNVSVGCCFIGNMQIL